jgi:hypothetical protein
MRTSSRNRNWNMRSAPGNRTHDKRRVRRRDLIVEMPSAFDSSAISTRQVFAGDRNVFKARRLKMPSATLRCLAAIGEPRSPSNVQLKLRRPLLRRVGTGCPSRTR